MRKAIWFLLAALWLIADQWTKYLAVIELKDKHQIIDFLPVLRWVYAENHGAAFSFLAAQGGWQKWFFLAVGVVAAIVLVRLIWQSRGGAFFAPFGYASILGGAIGNVYDRATLGYVRDMISFHIDSIGFNFAIFNVADVAISVGVGALIIDWLLSLRKDKDLSQAA